MKKINVKNMFKPIAQPECASTALLILRIVAGIAFLFHGWGKIQHPMSWAGPDSPIPGVFLLLAAISEFGGGIAWILGLLTPLASFGMACTMLVATYMHMIVLKDPFVSKGAGGSYELAALYLAISILFLMVGPGKFSLDKVLFKEKKL